MDLRLPGASIALVAAGWLMVSPRQSSAQTNDTPQNTMLAFEHAYETEDVSIYGGLLTGNFRFRFSANTDPELVATWGDNWVRTDREHCSRPPVHGDRGWELIPGCVEY